MSYVWASSEEEASHAYLLPTILDVLARATSGGKTMSIIDIGSGNGALTAKVAGEGYRIMGVEPSETGLAHARGRFHGLRFENGDAYEDLQGRFGEFDVVLSCEVIEHLMDPELFLNRVRALMKPGSIAIVTTPYHGYVKNVLIAAAGKWDFHHHPQKSWGHVKFFSRSTLNEVAEAAGLREREFHRVGRLPMIAKSMIAVYGLTP